MQNCEELGEIGIKVLNEAVFDQYKISYAVNDHKVAFIKAFNDLENFIFSHIQKPESSQLVHEVNEYRNGLIDVFNKIPSIIETNPQTDKTSTEQI